VLQEGDRLTVIGTPEAIHELSERYGLSTGRDGPPPEDA